jgi:transcriptional regulator with XRE-family HTH domain
MDNEFSKWLIAEMNRKGWSQADLARHSSLTRQAIANYVAGRIPDNDSLIELARVFKTKPEMLFRIAQGLPANPDADPWVEEMSHKLTLLSPGLRAMAERLIISMVEGEEADQRKSKNKPKPKTSTP